MRALAVLVMLVFVGCAALERGTSGSSGPARAAAPAPQRHVLGNGVVLIVQEQRASEVVALQLWMRVGGRDEAPDELGLSHYLEHMLFKGTATRPPGSIDRMIEGVGGQSNAFTSPDYTHYDVMLPADRAREGIALLADIAVNASFDQEELDRERQVVFEEMRLTEDDPERFLSRRLAEVAYEPTPYGEPILGTRPLIERLTREQLDRYYRKYYGPRSMTLVVVGAIDPAQIRRIADETFGRLQRETGQRPPMPPQPALTGGRRDDVRRPERQAYLGLAWKAPETPNPDIFAADLLSYILGDGPSSRLNVAVREREGLVSTIESIYVPREKGGLLTVTARLDVQNLERAEAAILEVIKRLQAEGVTDAERQRAIVTAESFYAFELETADGQAKTYGQAETTWTLADELRYLERLRAVTTAEIQAAARRYLSLTDFARVRFLPAGAQ
jgi:zinc protease